MPLRINELTSNVRVAGNDGSSLNGQIERIVQIVLERVRAEQGRMTRTREETMIRDGVSEVEPY